jgi:hypothetical protein
MGFNPTVILGHRSLAQEAVLTLCNDLTYVTAIGGLVSSYKPSKSPDRQKLVELLIHALD